MRALELRHLRTIQAIHRFGQFGKAAEFLHLTQSALSHQINTLESQIGVEIFHRGSRPLQFTQAGEIIFELAESVLPTVAWAGEKITRLQQGDAGRLHIGFECHSCFDWLIPTLSHFQEKWPQIDVDLTLGFSFDPFPALLRGDLDSVVTSDPVKHKDINYYPLFHYQTILVTSHNHKLAKRPWVEPNDIAEETLICYPVDLDRLDIVKRFLRPAKCVPTNVRTSELTIMILQLVACNRGIAGLPNWAVPEPSKHKLATVPLGKGGTWNTLYIATRATDSESKFMQNFLSTARSISVTELTGIKEIEVHE